MMTSAQIYSRLGEESGSGVADVVEDHDEQQDRNPDHHVVRGPEIIVFQYVLLLGTVAQIIHHLAQLLLRQTAEVQLFLNLIDRELVELPVHVHQVERPASYALSKHLQEIDVLPIFLGVLDFKKQFFGSVKLTSTDKDLFSK